MGTFRQRIKLTKLYYPLSIIKWSIKDIPLMIGAFWFHLFHIHPNKIVFSSFHGEQYNAQPKCVSEWLEKNADQELDLVWILPDTIKKGAFRTVRPRTIKSVYELMTAAVWVDNCRKPYWLKKRKAQLYIQTWHGPVCIKAVEKDAQDTLLPYYVLSAKQDSKNADYIVAESRWRMNNIRNSFWYYGSFIKGFFYIQRQNDESQRIRSVREYYHLDDETKIVTYVPTFRKTGTLDSYISDYNILIDSLKERYGGKWVVIIRLHPNIASKGNLIEYNEKILNGTSYSNSDDLIIASDMVITDYSGCMFDAYNHGKRMIIYAADYEDYIENDRNIYFDYTSLPAPLVKSSEELREAILCFRDEEYESKRKKLVEELGYYTDDAAKECGEIIIKFLNKRKDIKL